MRALFKWSDSSFMVTPPSPCQGEPSRCMALSLSRHVLEVAGVDHFEAGLFDRQPQQPPARVHDGGRRFRADVSIGEESDPVWPRILDRKNAGHGLKPIG